MRVPGYTRRDSHRVIPPRPAEEPKLGVATRGLEASRDARVVVCGLALVSLAPVVAGVIAPSSGVRLTMWPLCSQVARPAPEKLRRRGSRNGAWPTHSPTQNESLIDSRPKNESVIRSREENVSPACFVT